MPLDPTLTIDDLRAEVARLQDLADARLYRARAARITLESIGIPRSTPVDVGAARAVGIIEDLRAELARLQSGGCARDQRTTQFCAEAVARDAEIARLRSELAAAQPVVEWRGDVGTVGVFNAIVSAVGWVLFVPLADGSRTVIGIGPETGPAGKAAAVAAYRRACGFPPQTARRPAACVAVGGAS